MARAVLQGATVRAVRIVRLGAIPDQLYQLPREALAIVAGCSRAIA